LIATKKRKVNVDPSQHRLDRFLSSSISPSASQSSRDDPMQIDSTRTQQQQNETSSDPLTVNVSSLLGTFRQQSLIPCIAIANANRKS
jgi:hypothetical protein